MKNNHRIIGGINTISSLKAKNLFIGIKNIILTNSIEAEISKLAENTYNSLISL